MMVCAGLSSAKTKNENDDNKIDLFSRARTVLAAVRRLRLLLLDFGGQQNRRRRFFRLRVLVLGADRNEGATDVETERIFKECGEEIPMDVSLVGPNVPKTFKTASRSPLCDDYGPKGCVHVAERERCLFHERRGLTCCDTKKEREREGRDEQQQQQQQQHDVCEYDCAFAFNAGVWGYDSWMESLRRAVERYPKMPVVVTAYSMKECEMDEDCVREAFEEEEIRFVWEAEENKHHGEKVGGEENGRENSAWMCFVSNSGE
jgi:hypothetical protein